MSACQRCGQANGDLTSHVCSYRNFIVSHGHDPQHCVNDWLASPEAVERLAGAMQSSGLMRRYREYAERLPTMRRIDGIDELNREWAAVIVGELRGKP